MLLQLHCEEGRVGFRQKPFAQGPGSGTPGDLTPPTVSPEAAQAEHLFLLSRDDGGTQLSNRHPRTLCAEFNTALYIGTLRPVLEAGWPLSPCLCSLHSYVYPVTAGLGCQHHFHKQPCGPGVVLMGSPGAYPSVARVPPPPSPQRMKSPHSGSEPSQQPQVLLGQLLH